MPLKLDRVTYVAIVQEVFGKDLDLVDLSSKIAEVFCFINNCEIFTQ